MKVPGIKIGFYAPTFDQANITSRRARTRLKALGIKVRDLTEIDNTKVIQFRCPSDPCGPYAWREEGSLLGIYSHSKTTSKEGQTWDLIVTDEAQDADKEVYEKEIQPMGSSTNATELFIGTPWSEDAMFFEKIQISIQGGFFVAFPWQIVAQSVPNYGKFIEKKARELGKDSIAFLTQYCLKWIKGLGNFFNPDDFRKLESEMPWQTRPQNGKTYAFGLDVAGDDEKNTGSSDWTVFTVVEVDRSQVKTKDDKPKTTVVFIEAWQGVDWEEQYRAVCRLIRHWRPKVGEIDATGMGSPFSDRIVKAFPSIDINRFVFTEQSKSDLGHYAMAETSAGRSQYCNTENDAMAEFKKQARYLKREAKKNKRIAYYVPEDKGHDDYMISWFLAQKASSHGHSGYTDYLKNLR